MVCGTMVDDGDVTVDQAVERCLLAREFRVVLFPVDNGGFIAPRAEMPVVPRWVRWSHCLIASRLVHGVRVQNASNAPARARRQDFAT